MRPGLATSKSDTQLKDSETGESSSACGNIAIAHGSPTAMQPVTAERKFPTGKKIPKAPSKALGERWVE